MLNISGCRKSLDATKRWGKRSFNSVWRHEEARKEGSDQQGGSLKLEPLTARAAPHPPQVPSSAPSQLEAEVRPGSQLFSFKRLFTEFLLFHGTGLSYFCYVI